MGRLKRKGSSVLAIMLAVIIFSGLLCTYILRMTDVGFKSLSASTKVNQAMQYAMNEIDLCRATRYSLLESKPREAISGTGFQRKITVNTDSSSLDTKIVKVEIFEGSDSVPLSVLSIKKSKISDRLHDSVGTGIDHSMTQKAMTDSFALKSDVFSKDETYNIFLTQARAGSLLQALEDAVADNYLTKQQAENIYRKISDSYSKGDYDSLLAAIQEQVRVNKFNISSNESNIDNRSTRLKTVEDGLSLYITINEAADIYLTKTLAASIYSEKAVTVTHPIGMAVGSSIRPVYVDFDGTAKVLSGTVGSEQAPVYLKNGVFTEAPIRFSGYCSEPPTTISTASSDKPCVIVQNYSEGTEWYRVWSDGFCEQGGKIEDDNLGSYISIVNMKIPYKDTNYSIKTLAEGPSYGSTGTCSHWFPITGTKTVDSFKLNTCKVSHFHYTYWVTRGFIR